MGNRMRYLARPQQAPPETGEDDFFLGRLPNRGDARAAGNGWAAPWDGRASAPALREALRDRSLYVRAAAALSLGKTAGPEAVADLLPLLRSDPSTHVRALAALGIGFAGGTEATVGLLDWLRGASARDANGHVLAFGVLALGLTGEASAREVLAASTASPDAEIRGAAARALGWLGDRSAVEPLLALLRREDGDPVARGYAAAALARLRAAEALPALLRASASREVEVRRAAALALPDFPQSAEVPPRLLRLLERDRNAVVRGYAAIGLGRTGGEGARDALRRELARGNRALRPFAAIGLGLLAAEDPREPDRALLLDRFREAREEREKAAAAIALGLARASESKDEIERFATEAKSAEDRLYATDALALLSGERPPEDLRREIALRPEPTFAAAFALRARPPADASVAPVLLDLAGDRRNAALAAPAAFAVGASGDPSTGRALLALLADEKAHASVRAGAAFSLGTLAEPGAVPRLTSLGFGEDVAEDRRTAMRELRELP